MRLNFLNGFPQLARTSGVEAGSWIMNRYCQNLQEIMNLCTSAQESWITRLWEKLNKIQVKIDVWINCVRSRECRTWRFHRPIFKFFCRGACPGTHSGLTVRLFLQWHWVLNVQLQKTPHLDKTNEDTEKQWSKIYIILVENRSLDTTWETIQNETT